MFELLIGITSGQALSLIGILAIIVSAIVQVLKNILPSKIPTKLLAVVVSLLIVVAVFIIFGGVSIQSVVLGIFGSLIVSFTAMFGFDTTKDIFEKIKTLYQEGKESDE